MTLKVIEGRSTNEYYYIIRKYFFHEIKYDLEGH